MTKRTIKTYFSNPNRDTPYDDALRAHLAATWDQPGLTYSQAARLIRTYSALRGVRRASAWIDARHMVPELFHAQVAQGKARHQSGGEA